MSKQPTSKAPPNQSSAFFMAFERCMEQRPLPNGQFQIPLVPAIVCAAFSIELGLKALAEAEGTKLRGHKLANLFEKLSPRLQSCLISDVGVPKGAFDQALATATDTFVDWRYVHEQASPNANIGFLTALARAVQKALGTVK